MQPYVVKMIFRILCGEGNHTPQFDEQLRLVYANDNLHALEKATKIGRREQESFRNANGDLVQWQFIDVPELYDLNRIGDGLEICSRVYETEHSRNYIDLVQSKANLIRSDFKRKIEEAV